MEYIIYPQYELKQNDSVVDLESYVRKYNNEVNEWYLIPVHMRWDKGEQFTDKTLTTVMDLFHEQCYRLLIMWKFNKKGEEEEFINGEKDPIQIEESERLTLLMKEKIKQYDK